MQVLFKRIILLRIFKDTPTEERNLQRLRKVYGHFGS